MLIPFQVPPGASILEIQYTYTGAQDKESNVVDLGLFDARGSQFLSAEGFRGWSGSARSALVLTPAEATPGYLPGPLYPGTWHIVLGLYRIAAEGCEVSIAISITCGQPASNPPPVPLPSAPLREGPAWFCGDLHTHTHHSDATGSVPALIQAARAQGLDFVAVTDHNTSSHIAALARHATSDLLLIPGLEITTYRGHANVWGIRSWIEFRAHAAAQMRQIRDLARARGLVFSINHPKPGGPAWQYEGIDADAIEGWQAPWFLGNIHSLAFWDALLREGKRPTLVGGSDKHQGPFEGKLSAYEVGTPTTWVYAQHLSERAVLEGIRRGRVYLSRTPAGPHLSLTARAVDRQAMMGDTLSVHAGEAIRFCCTVKSPVDDLMLRIVHRAGEWMRMPIEDQVWTYEWERTATTDDYWRVEIIEIPDAPLETEPTALIAWALSNPIYLRID
jgi:hypothetical protein